ncbi:ORC-CDC6 family AAA ATPase [Mycolicibacterium sp. Dal123E01]|uniref:ORC-CDC6 family AAA ATPase n=1 Tax=Mycolicibacterium sp. Dal123E01 TaxID=3457578 RepID=UPI00403E7EF6
MPGYQRSHATGSFKQMAILNPFEITKAVDFTDDQIRDTFVEYPDVGYDSFASPVTPMSKFLVGGKGGGRTHLMRHYSYTLRRTDSDRILDKVASDGYLGIYFRCSGLNSSRFRGKHISRETWSATFNFYLDVWLTENLLNILVDIEDIDKAWDAKSQSDFVKEVLNVVSAGNGPGLAILNSTTVAELRDSIAHFRKVMDRSINNVALRGALEVEVISNPGSLIFATTMAAKTWLSGLSEVFFTFLIDEFENLSLDQQMYVNTLIREKTLPTTFVIGSRRWGVKTHLTYSAEEENKTGSEYEWIELENKYRDTGTFDRFCFNLTKKRLAQAGFSEFAHEDQLRSIFSNQEAQSHDRLGDDLALSLLGGEDSSQRKHLLRLHENVLRATRNNGTADSIVSIISRPQSPMSEKLAIHKFYQSWSSKHSLDVGMAEHAAGEIDSLRDGTGSANLDYYLNLWKNDLLAQVYLSCDRRSPYVGIDRFIEMSGFLPRSFLMTMKYVTQAALVRGQTPFANAERISSEAQMAGVLEASRWFLRDSLPTETLGPECESAIRRLGTLFNRARYSDKPVEVSCVAFSTDLHGVSGTVRTVIETCVSHSLLVEVLSGRKTRNKGSVWRKYQLHPMLAPLYALPTGRRGEMQLSAEEVHAIFDSEMSDVAYSAAMRRRLNGMNAPFSEGTVHNPDQAGLF